MFARGRQRGAAGYRVAWLLLFAAALLLKSSVPLLAAAAARLQGKAVAEVCAVYGVALPAPAAHVHGAPVDGAAHPAGHVHAMPAAAMAMADAPARSGLAGVQPAPVQPHESPHAQDHCALSGLAAAAAFAEPPWLLAGRLGTSTASPPPQWPGARGRDASARWLALQLHAPPALA